MRWTGRAPRPRRGVSAPDRARVPPAAARRLLRRRLLGGGPVHRAAAADTVLRSAVARARAVASDLEVSARPLPGAAGRRLLDEAAGAPAGAGQPCAVGSAGPAAVSGSSTLAEALARRTVERALEAWRPVFPDVPVHTALVWGAPERALVAESHGAAVLVLGGRSRGTCGDRCSARSAGPCCTTRTARSRSSGPTRRPHAPPERPPTPHPGAGAAGRRRSPRRRSGAARVDGAPGLVPVLADGFGGQVPTPGDRRRDPDVVARTDHPDAFDGPLGPTVDPDPARARAGRTRAGRRRPGRPCGCRPRRCGTCGSGRRWRHRRPGTTCRRTPRRPARRPLGPRRRRWPGARCPASSGRRSRHR